MGATVHVYGWFLLVRCQREKRVIILKSVLDWHLRASP